MKYINRISASPTRDPTRDPRTPMGSMGMGGGSPTRGGGAGGRFQPLGTPARRDPRTPHGGLTASRGSFGLMTQGESGGSPTMRRVQSVGPGVLAVARRPPRSPIRQRKGASSKGRQGTGGAAPRASIQVPNIESEDAILWLREQGFDTQGPPKHWPSVGEFHNTPVLWATSEGRLDVVSWLVDHGCSLTKADDFGNTALSVAHLYKHFELHAWLQRRLPGRV